MFDVDSLLQSKAERGGVVLHDGTVVELPNASDEPELGYYPDPKALLPYLDDMAGTWHTHPDGTANLSVEDAQTFILWPDLTHHIIGTDGVRSYRVKNGAVVNV